jgi:CheY-like chemotaxis protein
MPDLILMDIQMPNKKTDMKLHMEIRQINGSAAIPIIAVTANNGRG